MPRHLHAAALNQLRTALASVEVKWLVAPSAGFAVPSYPHRTHAIITPEVNPNPQAADKAATWAKVTAIS